MLKQIKTLGLSLIIGSMVVTSVPTTVYGSSDLSDKQIKQLMSTDEYKVTDKKLQKIVKHCLKEHGEPKENNKKNKEFVYFTDFNYKLHKNNKKCNCEDKLSISKQQKIHQRQCEELHLITVQEFNELASEMNMREDAQSKYSSLSYKNIKDLNKGECEDSTRVEAALTSYIQKELKDELVERIVERYNIKETSKCKLAIDETFVSNYMYNNAPLRQLVIDEILYPTEVK